MASSVAFSSLSSTAMLQLVSTPYVFALYEDKSESNGPERQLYVEKVNFFGRVVGFPFGLEQADKGTKHPFASFHVKPSGENFYVFGEGLSHDPVLREKLCKD